METVNARTAEPITLHRPAGAPERSAYGLCAESHWLFRRAGIASVQFTTAQHADARTVADETDRIDFEKLARVTALVAATPVELANAPARPVVADLDVALPAGCAIR